MNRSDYDPAIHWLLDAIPELEEGDARHAVDYMNQPHVKHLKVGSSVFSEPGAMMRQPLRQLTDNERVLRDLEANPHNTAELSVD